MRAHKYGAIPTEVDGIRFASIKESRRYMELKLLERAGKIRNLKLQPVFELTVENGIYPDGGCGRSIMIGKYRGDFDYEEQYTPWRPQNIVGTTRFELPENEWRRKVEDVKGFKTPLYRWKKKHVEAQYGIQIVEV